MLRRISHLLLVAALLAAIGGHWALLQSFAWATMLADNLKTTSLTEAVERTFDGEHPCRCCKAIAEGKQSERKSDSPALKLKKLDFRLDSVHFAFVAPSEFQLLPGLRQTGTAKARTPPVPPPRPIIG